MWSLKLQQEIGLSTIESDCISLSSVMRELLLPQRELLNNIGIKMNLQSDKPEILHSTEVDGNYRVSTNITTPKIIPRTKHIVVAYHFLTSKIGKEKGIMLQKIDNENQLADIFTEGLHSTLYKPFRNIMIGWESHTQKQQRERNNNTNKCYPSLRSLINEV